MVEEVAALEAVVETVLLLLCENGVFVVDDALE